VRSRWQRTEKGYPLRIEATRIVEEPSEFDGELLSRMLPKLEYSTVVQACQQLREQQQQQQQLQQEAAVGGTDGSTGHNNNDGDGDSTAAIIIIPEIPEELPASATEGELDETLARTLYRLLFDIHVVEGHLVCPDTGRRFAIKDGIPNMVLHEDEL